MSSAGLQLKDNLGQAGGRGVTRRQSGADRLVEKLMGIGRLNDEAIPLAETALMLGALQRRDLDLAPYHQHLAEIALDAADRASHADSVGMQLAALSHVMAERHGYAGDTASYDDPRNANLVDVIDRRCGLPVALGILYIHAARAYGAEIAGLAFPSHFLLRLSARGQRLIFDAFDGGRAMTAQDLRRRLKDLQGADAEIQPEHYAAVGNRDILLRLQNNLKMRAIGAGDLSGAIDILGSMALVAPDRGELAWETAVLQSRLGNVRTAIATLESYLAVGTPVTAAAEIEDLLRRLKSRIN
jgi:regulator of sirC expression with transglutaminase-like and TPR domain